MPSPRSASVSGRGSGRKRRSWRACWSKPIRRVRRVREREAEQVFIGGASQIFETPEFADVEKMRSLFRAFEDKYKLITLLDKTAAAEVSRSS